MLPETVEQRVEGEFCPINPYINNVNLIYIIVTLFTLGFERKTRLTEKLSGEKLRLNLL